jgi:AcrR family transcriptional regulator
MGHTKSMAKDSESSPTAITSEETRLKITEALVELHRTVGPAHTTVTEVAEKAGVGRMTVYNHFANDAEMIGACSAHWAAHNPAPDPANWATVSDTTQRVLSALHDLYRFYQGNQDMLGQASSKSRAAKTPPSSSSHRLDSTSASVA